MKIRIFLFFQGLNCVDKDQPKGKNIGLVETQRTCSPSKAIPLHYMPLNKSTKAKDHSTSDQDGPQMCSPSIPIPLHYSPLNSKEGQVDGEGHTEPSEGDDNGKTSSVDQSNRTESSSSCSTFEGDSSSTACSEEESTSKSWHVVAKFQLLKKAAITYFVMAKELFEIKRYGHALRHLRYAVHCFGKLMFQHYILLKKQISVRSRSW